MPEAAERAIPFCHLPDPDTACELTVHGMAPVHALWVIGVSARQCQVVTQVPVRAGERVDVELSHPARGTRRRHVAWVAFCLREPGGRCRVGLTFVGTLTAFEVEALC
jgi:hypothetical protein